ncbi:MAG: flagellar biosynthesis protein FlgL, partial [Gammaproteobacteria bacterium]|nr:flagellar biosynthesis protein FlgL [Gammaproteobacteria bacterium]
SEGRIEAEKVRNQAMSVVFELEHSAILSADPYETVTKLEALQGQLQTIYTVTARLSNLSLTNFLR